MGQKLISAIIIYATGCDKKLFENAKKSVSWCDELVLINGVEGKGSFNDWRNKGLKESKGKWVLYLDVDEEITSDLRSEITQLINKSENSENAYAIPRRNFIFGQELKYCGLYPDYVKRLFKRSVLRGWTGELHEEPSFKGQIGHLKNPMVHYKNITLSEMIEKTNKWSEIEADLMIKANHPPMNIFRFASAGFREFVLRFIKQTAFLDGTKGTIYGIYQIYSRLISYSKLWEKQQSTIHT